MKWISIIFFLFFVIPEKILNSSPASYSFETIQRADSLYSNKQYKEALQEFISLSKNNDHRYDDPKFDFKLAYCYYKNKQYVQAQNILINSELLQNFLPQYTDYLRFKTLLNINHDPEKIESAAANYYNDYKNHFLTDSVINFTADYFFENRKYEKAKKYYSDLYKRKNKYKKSSSLRKQLALCEYEIGNKEIALDKMIQILKKYPSSKDALDIVKFLQERRLDDEDLFFHIIDVYLNNGQIKYLNNKLKAYINVSPDESQTEKALYYLNRVYFNQGNYKSALIGFRRLYENVNDEKLKPKILVYTARCYLKLGNNSKSAETYISYSKEFPRRRLAAECAWKAAWIYEEMNDLEKALEQYRSVQKHWPRNSFRYEAKFREALTLYRLGYYSSSVLIFKEIINSRWSDVQKNRAKYWLALAYKKLDQYEFAQNLFIELGKNVFQDYYTMKAYLQVKSIINLDSFSTNKMFSNKNPLQKHKTSIEFDSEKYSRLFLINELIGRSYVFKEINQNEYKPKDLAGWITQAEIYKKLGNYNKTFKIYDMIDYTYFGEYGIFDKPFILKEKYPFYFDSEIEKYSSKKDLDKHFVLAVVRAESGFDRNAHSYANAYGLMQLIPRTAVELAGELDLEYSNPKDLFDTDLNLQLGIHYISKLANKYENQKEYILAAYNAGPHRVKRWKNYNNNDTIDFLAENIEFMQTRNYVKKVLKNYWTYSLLDEIY